MRRFLGGVGAVAVECFGPVGAVGSGGVVAHGCVRCGMVVGGGWARYSVVRGADRAGGAVRAIVSLGWGGGCADQLELEVIGQVG